MLQSPLNLQHSQGAEQVYDFPWALYGLVSRAAEGDHPTNHNPCQLVQRDKAGLLFVVGPPKSPVRGASCEAATTTAAKTSYFPALETHLVLVPLWQFKYHLLSLWMASALH